MSQKKKIKVVDFESLQLEKQRLRKICDTRKTVLDQKLTLLKENYPEVVIKTILPFNDATNEIIFKSASWMHEIFSSFLADNHSKTAQFISGKGSSALQAILFYVFVRIGKNILHKLKKENE